MIPTKHSCGLPAGHYEILQDILKDQDIKKITEYLETIKRINKLLLPKLNIILTLSRIKVSLAVTFTAITGYLIYLGSFHLQLLLLGLGVFILASGASALNQCQEKDHDAKMDRTQHRPLPSKKIGIKQALTISIILIITGLVHYFFLAVLVHY